jgi:hypothetical protein
MSCWQSSAPWRTRLNLPLRKHRPLLPLPRSPIARFRRWPRSRNSYSV